jgi:hypothetical protein
MRQDNIAVNPFSLMVEPEAIFQAIERSERLNRLQRHVCRPLDRPVIPLAGDEDADDSDRGTLDLETAASIR